MDELRGRQGTWRLDGKSVLIRYAVGRRQDRLLARLGHCDVPVSAIASVDFRPGVGMWKGWALRLELVERGDPYSAVGGALARRAQPFMLTGPAKSELVAEYWADQIRFAAQEAGPESVPPDVATRFVPRLPLHVQTAEGTAAFDGRSVRLVWSGSKASSVKKRAQRREFALADVTGVEWVPGDGSWAGYLRVVAPKVAGRSATKPKNDLCCLQWEPGDEGAAVLLMAASVMAYRWAGGTAAAPAIGAGGAGGGDAEGRWVYERLRHLGRLHEEGVLTDEEFAAKKAELLGRL